MSPKHNAGFAPFLLLRAPRTLLCPEAGATHGEPVGLADLCELGWPRELNSRHDFVSLENFVSGSEQTIYMHFSLQLILN